MEDLFDRLFRISPQERITFIGLREHPIFKHHFPVIHEASKITYSKRIQIVSMTSDFRNSEEENAIKHMSRIHVRSSELK